MDTCLRINGPSGDHPGSIGSVDDDPRGSRLPHAVGTQADIGLAELRAHLLPDGSEADL